MNSLLSLYPGGALLVLGLNLLINVSVVALFVLLLARTVLRHRPAARHSVACCAVLYLLFSPMICQWVAGRDRAWGTLSIPARSMETSILNKIRSIPALRADFKPAVRPAKRRLSTAGIEEARPMPLSAYLRAWATLFCLIWSGGIVLGCVRFVRSWRQVALLQRGVYPVDERGLEAVFLQVKRALGVRKLPSIVSTPHLAGPLVAGYRRPLVILPEDLIPRLSHSQLRDVLIHECAHVIRHHPVEGLLQRMVEILFWPHPLVHALGRELAQAREEVCDNYVLAQANAPHYARTLLAIAEGIACPQATMPLALLPPRLRLEHRVAGLLDPGRNRETQIGLWKSGVVLLVFHFLGSMAVVREGAAQTPAPSHLRLLRLSSASAAAPLPSARPLMPTESLPSEENSEDSNDEDADFDDGDNAAIDNGIEEDVSLSSDQDNNTEKSVLLSIKGLPDHKIEADAGFGRKYVNGIVELTPGRNDTCTVAVGRPAGVTVDLAHPMSVYISPMVRRHKLAGKIPHGTIGW